MWKYLYINIYILDFHCSLQPIYTWSSSSSLQLCMIVFLRYDLIVTLLLLLAVPGQKTRTNDITHFRRLWNMKIQFVNRFTFVLSRFITYISKGHFLVDYKIWYQVQKCIMNIFIDNIAGKSKKYCFQLRPLYLFTCYLLLVLLSLFSICFEIE